MEAQPSYPKSPGVVQHMKYVVHATLDEVAWVTEAVRGLIPLRLPEEDSYAIELGIAEVLTNIVQHGYLGQKDGSITVNWKEYMNRLEVNISDRGLPIPSGLLKREARNPFDFDLNNIQELSENGFGLMLVKTVFDRVDYQSSEGVNRMHLEKKFPD